MRTYTTQKIIEEYKELWKNVPPVHVMQYPSPSDVESLYQAGKFDSRLWVGVDDLKKEIEEIRTCLAQHQFRCENNTEDWLCYAYLICNDLLETGRVEEQDSHSKPAMVEGKGATQTPKPADRVASNSDAKEEEKEIDSNKSTRLYEYSSSLAHSPKRENIDFHEKGVTATSFKRRGGAT